MADPTPTVSSIKARISALNLEQVGVTPNAPPPYTYEQALPVKKTRPPPPPPPARSQTTNVPVIRSNAPPSTKIIGNQPIKNHREPPKERPALPPRPPPRQPQQVPELPPRRPSEQSIRRRGSVESVSSGHSSISTVSTRTSV